MKVSELRVGDIVHVNGKLLRDDGGFVDMNAVVLYINDPGFKVISYNPAITYRNGNTTTRAYRENNVILHTSEGFYRIGHNVIDNDEAHIELIYREK